MSVPEGNPAESIDLDRVLIELADLNDGAGSVPSTWLWAHLVLYADMVSHTEGRKPSGVFPGGIRTSSCAVSEGLVPAGAASSSRGVGGIVPEGWG